MNASTVHRVGAWWRGLVVLAALLGLSGLAFGAAQGSQSISNIESTQPLPREQERQVQRIGAKLHCPVCSGESIAQSQTDISRQMMNEVRDLVRRGVPEQAILAQFVGSYGERILMEPPKRGLTSLLWTLPVAFLVLGGLLWVSYLRRASRPVEQTLSPEEERRIAALLAERTTETKIRTEQS